MKKFKNVFLAFFVTALTSLNLALPAYAEEATTQTVDSAGFSVSVVGDGTVTLSSGDFTKSLSNGDIYNADYEEGTEIKIVSKSNENAVIDDVALNNSTISGFTSGKKSFSFVYATSNENACFKVSFKKIDVKTNEESKTDSDKSKEIQDDKAENIKNDNQTSDSIKNEEYEKAKLENTIQSRIKSSFDTDEMDLDDSKNVVLKYLYVDKDKVSPKSTMKSVLVDNNPSEIVYMQTQETAQVYLDANGDYKILANTPFVNGFASSNQAYDWDVARGNDNANMISEGVTYDVKSHIITIKPSVFKTVAKEQKSEDKKNEDFSDLQFQFLIPVDASKNVSVKATVENDANLIEPSVNDTVELNPFMVTRFQLATKKTANNIEQKDIAVYINNRQDSLEADQYAYNPKTGILALDIKGAELRSVDIVVSKRVGRAAGVATSNVKIGQLGVLAYLKDGTDDSAFTVGASADVRGKFGHSNYWALTIDEPTSLYQRSRTLNSAGEYSLIGPPNGDGGEWAYTYAGLGIPKSIKLDNNKTIDFSLYDANGNSYGTWVNGGRGLIENNVQDNGVVYNAAIKGYCHHIAVHVGDVNTSSLAALRYPTCTFRIIAKQKIGDYMHVVVAYETNLHMFTEAGGGQQTCGTSFEIAYKIEAKGKLSIMKKSANPAITDNNPCYELKGAEYGVYKTEADAKADKNKVNTLTIGKYDDTEKNKNWSNEIELEAGTYYVKETKAPKGYALNPNAVKVVIEAGKNTWIGEESNDFVDYPQSDPVRILLGKVDKETNKNKPQGSASLAGAEFTVKYYKGLYDSDPAKSGQVPNRSWVLKTNSNGKAYLNKDYKVSGDDFYYASNGDPTFPIGTVTIQETKAPTGYFINNEVFVRKITTSGSVEGVDTYNQPEILEKVIKFDIKKVQAGTSTPVAGAVFRHTLPDGSTKDLETNGSGEITITGLASGTHKIKEIKSPDGYQLNPNEVVFNVASGTGKITFTSGTNSLVTQGTKDSGDGYATFSDKVNPFNLKITKTNEHGKVLKGAEFRLYSDEGCKNVVDTQISDDNGLLTFKNLDVEKTYYFQETKAPQGYRIPVDENGKAYVHSVYVKATPQNNAFDFTIDNVQYNTSKTSGNIRLEGTKKNRVVAVDITNKTTQLLPETGSNGTILLIGLGVAVIAFALYKSKKDKMISK